jgi:predicted phosphoribosyltransferase
MSEPLNEATYLFRDRIEAGQLLAQKLREYANRGDVVVLALYSPCHEAAFRSV